MSVMRSATLCDFIGGLQNELLCSLGARSLDGQCPYFGRGLRRLRLTVITAGIGALRNGVRRSHCGAAIFSDECPLWVKSGHWGTSDRCPLYPQKLTLELGREMSAMCQTRKYAGYRRRLENELIDLANVCASASVFGH